MLGSVTNIVSSALQSSAKSLEVSAQNIASLAVKGQTANSQENSKPTIARRVENTSLVEGGVKTQVKDSNSPVSLEQELVNQKFAAYQADASLKVLKTADAMTGYLLDITA